MGMPSPKSQAKLWLRALNGSAAGGGNELANEGCYCRAGVAVACELAVGLNPGELGGEEMIKIRRIRAVYCRRS